jgi:hypothetical protein
MYRDEIANVARIIGLFPDAGIKRRGLESQIHGRFGRYYLAEGETKKARSSFRRSLLGSPINGEALLFLFFLAMPGWVRAGLIAANRRRRAEPGPA